MLGRCSCGSSGSLAAVSLVEGRTRDPPCLPLRSAKNATSAVSSLRRPLASAFDENISHRTSGR
ncbi:hypothetical protein U9M48_020579 [Paspalum notatum var. saurae]|uniref:Uncharacterized protein n=1 Tax=Paspalum notatum var. saurae TaxID=547442 RepID=A0AAQ3TF53_PASNO